MSTTEETTMSVRLADGTQTPPVPLSALEDARTRQLTLFEGQRYPDCKIALSGGVEGLTAELDDFTGLCVGDTFSATISGVVVSKRHAVKFDDDGNPERTLTVTLKADDVRPAS